jgi:hypothetical protein
MFYGLRRVSGALGSASLGILVIICSMSWWWHRSFHYGCARAKTTHGVASFTKGMCDMYAAEVDAVLPARALCFGGGCFRKDLFLSSISFKNTNKSVMWCHLKIQTPLLVKLR